MRNYPTQIQWLRARLPEFIFFGIGVILLVRLFRLSIDSASDFEVYWYAIRAWVGGGSPYAQYSPVYPGLVFKYPPWILPLFLPFAWVPLDLSKWIWTFAQVLCVFYSMIWLRSKGLSTRLVCFVSLIFWWMWLAHAHFGQVMVFLLAFALWTYGPQAPSIAPFKSEFKLAFLSFLFTAKIFSVVSLLGVGKKILQVRVILYGILLLLISHLILIFSHSVTFSRFFVRDSIASMIQPYHEWIFAASSGGAELGAKIVRGQQNHGFVAAILRNFDADATHVSLDIVAALALALLFSLLWRRFSKSLASEERWAGWLTIGVIAHPLAWHHSFTMVFSLCVFSLHRAIQTRNKGLIFLSLLGASCIGLLIPQVIGVDAVVPIENIGSKSWGALFAAIALVLARMRIPV